MYDKTGTDNYLNHDVRVNGPLTASSAGEIYLPVDTYIYFGDKWHEDGSRNGFSITINESDFKSQ